MSEAEVTKAKRQLEVSLINGLATSHSLASRLGQDFTALGRIRSLEERLDAIATVSAADVKRVVSTLLVKEKRSVVHVVPPPADVAARAAAAEKGAQ